MYLSRFVVTDSFGAWSPEDRDHPERRIAISPGPKDLFTDEAEKDGIFVKFLRNGEWFEAARCDFARATILLQESQGLLTAQRGA